MKVTAAAVVPTMTAVPVMMIKIMIIQIIMIIIKMVSDGGSNDESVIIIVDVKKLISIIIMLIIQCILNLYCPVREIWFTDVKHTCTINTVKHMNIFKIKMWFEDVEGDEDGVHDGYDHNVDDGDDDGLGPKCDGNRKSQRQV